MVGHTEVIQDYLENNFSPEQVSEFLNTIALTDAFNETSLYDKLYDAVFDIGDDDKDARQQLFLSAFHEVADKVLSVHDLSLLSPVTLRTKNRILSALYSIQSIEDPVPFARILETSLSNEEMFAKIVSHLSELDEGTVLESVGDISDTFIDGLRRFLEDRENELDAVGVDNAEDFVIKTKVMVKLKSFLACFGVNTLVTGMSDIGLLPAQSTDLYWPHVKDSIVMTDDKETAVNLLGLFIYGKDTFMNPMAAYERCSESLVKDTAKRVAIANQLRDVIMTLDNYMKAQDDAKRVSAV